VPKHDRALIDTSVVIDLDIIDPDRLPNEFAMSAVTLAELAAGPLATDDLKQRVLRQDRLQRAESTIMTISLDRDAARAYARVYAANLAAGRRSRIKFADDLIAATAIASNLALYTRNAADFTYLDEILEVVEV
jgi:predicted nucleic acid-binding protein